MPYDRCRCGTTYHVNNDGFDKSMCPQCEREERAAFIVLRAVLCMLAGLGIAILIFIVFLGLHPS